MKTSLATLVTPFLVCLAMALAGCASDGPGPIDAPSIADSPDADMDPIAAPAFGDLDEPDLPARPPAPSMQPPAYTPPAYTPPAYTAPSYTPPTATGGFGAPTAPTPNYSAPAPSDAPSSCGGGGGG